MPTITNAGPGPIRWTLRRASSEFGISIPTLVARLNEADQTSAEDKTFTTKQLIESLFGSVHQERLAKLKAEREYTELQTGILRADFVPVQELTRILSEVANGMKQLIRAPKLDRTGQDDLLRSLAGIKIVVKGRSQPPSQEAGSRSKRRRAEGGRRVSISSGWVRAEGGREAEAENRREAVGPGLSQFSNSGHDSGIPDKISSRFSRTAGQSPFRILVSLQGLTKITT